MTTFANIGGAEPSTLTFKVATVQIARGSTNEQQEIICIGDPTSSLAVSAVTNSAPAGNAYAQAVRLAGGPSSAGDVVVTSIIQSGNSSVIVTSGNSSVTITAGNSSVISTPARTSTANLTNFSQSSATGTILSANAGRLGVLIVCDANAGLYVKYGASASTSSYSVLIPSQGYWEMPRPLYSGQIDGAWGSTGIGAARVTELT